MITMQMAPTARRILEQGLGLKAGEHLVLVTDTECPQTITQTLATMAQGLGVETVVVTQVPRPVGSVEPLRVVGAAMHAADAIITQASYAIGTNPKCRLGVTLREAKKAWGTAHVGVGGKISGPLHFDLILPRPTGTVDGEPLVKGGQGVA